MKGHVLIVADGRSPTALRWIENIQTLDYQVSLISTFPCEQPDGLRHFKILPIAFSRYSSGKKKSEKTEVGSPIKSLVSRFSPAFQTLRYHLGPLTVRNMSDEYQKIVTTVQPNLVHALRIPFEGMLASFTPKPFPLLVAIWGNDLTLHASGSRLMKRWTRRCLNRADALSADTRRDTLLAKEWGLKPEAPTLVVPGSGGMDLSAIQNAGPFDNSPYGIPESGEWILNPRGIRPGSVHQKTFFAAIPKILAEHPKSVFICPGLQGKRAVEGWIQSLGIVANTFLLPHLPQEELWALMKRSSLFVSPSSHDGTPNSFLEALACGCFPVVGDIESLREWIGHEKDGLLVNPRDPNALAEAIQWALDHPKVRAAAAENNLVLIKERAAQSATLPQIDTFYKELIR